MEFGIVLTTSYTKESPPEQQLREHIELVKLADALGFDYMAMGQHFLSDPLRYYQPIPYLVRMWMEAPRMKVATGIILLPLSHPVDMAEQIATLDVLTGGKATFGIGLGYTDREFQVFNVPRKGRVRRFEESLGLIKQLWTGEVVDHQGEFFTIPGLSTTVVPIQKPHPPVWLAGQSPEPVKRAARLGDAWYVPPFVTGDELIALHALYVEELEKHGKPRPNPFPVRRDVWIAPTKEQARREAFAAAHAREKTYLDWGMTKDLSQDHTFGSAEAEAFDNRWILGPGESVAEQIAALRDRIGMTHLMLKPQWVGLPFKETMRQMELFGKEVMPLLK